MILPEGESQKNLPVPVNWTPEVQDIILQNSPIAITLQQMHPTLNQADIAIAVAKVEQEISEHLLQGHYMAFLDPVPIQSSQTQSYAVTVFDLSAFVNNGINLSQ